MEHPCSPRRSGKGSGDTITSWERGQLGVWPEVRTPTRASHCLAPWRPDESGTKPQTTQFLFPVSLHYVRLVTPSGPRRRGQAVSRARARPSATLRDATAVGTLKSVPRGPTEEQHVLNPPPCARPPLAGAAWALVEGEGGRLDIMRTFQPETARCAPPASALGSEGAHTHTHPIHLTDTGPHSFIHLLQRFQREQQGPTLMSPLFLFQIR